jgi:hypothetical protein
MWRLSYVALRYVATSMERRVVYNDKKEKKIFLMYKEIQKGSVAKSYMTNGLLIYG